MAIAHVERELPASDQRCTITWGCDFELEGVPEATAVQMMESVYRDGFIANLARSLGVVAG